MRDVYLSFLGLGSHDKDTGSYRYTPTVYELDGHRSGQTEFVQVAELQLLKGPFDPVLIAGTDLSFQSHWDNLFPQLQAIGVEPRQILLEEDMSSQGQWRWFEAILERVKVGDRLTVDLTHGYRSIPIVFSAAINFLQKARGVSLAAVYYGAYDKNRDLVPIVDLKEFYAINEWADGVTRLVEDADAGKLARAALNAPSFQGAELNDDDLIKAFQQLTDSIRNVDVNRISPDAEQALSRLDVRRKGASATGRILLDLLREKYRSLVSDGSDTERYDQRYFLIQIQIIQLLIDHRLFMQAYTAMRECIVSIGMLGFEKEGMNNKKRKKRRSKYGEYFARMIQHEQEEWQFKREEMEFVERLTPFYDQLAVVGLLEGLRKLTGELVPYRNGFDHAWVGKPRPKDEIAKKAEGFLQRLSGIIERLAGHELTP